MPSVLDGKPRRKDNLLISPSVTSVGHESSNYRSTRSLPKSNDPAGKINHVSSMFPLLFPYASTAGTKTQPLPCLANLTQPPPSALGSSNWSLGVTQTNLTISRLTPAQSASSPHNFCHPNRIHEASPSREILSHRKTSSSQACLDVSSVEPGGGATQVAEKQTSHVSELIHELLKMSPCLRPDFSPTADDLGNYAMNSSQMELVWHGEFDRLFTQYYPHAWYLVPTFYPPSDRWRVFKDSAKVRFSCQECGHGWTSMKGRVIFWFHLNYSTNSGYVMFKLYGQQCQKCKNGSYEHAMWYPEEVVKVIGNVYNRVGQIFYGFVRPPLRIDRRQGKPRNQHNAELCQACKEGLCKEEWSFS